MVASSTTATPLLVRLPLPIATSMLPVKLRTQAATFKVKTQDLTVRALTLMVEELSLPNGRARKSVSGSFPGELHRMTYRAETHIPRLGGHRWHSSREVVISIAVSRTSRLYVPTRLAFPPLHQSPSYADGAVRFSTQPSVVIGPALSGPRRPPVPPLHPRVRIMYRTTRARSQTCIGLSAA